MGKDDLSHSHSVSNETVSEQIVNSILILDTGSQNTNFHSHDVSDSSGNSGHDIGHSFGEAQSNALSDYSENKK